MFSPPDLGLLARKWCYTEGEFVEANKDSVEHAAANKAGDADPCPVNFRASGDGCGERDQRRSQGNRSPGGVGQLRAPMVDMRHTANRQDADPTEQNDTCGVTGDRKVTERPKREGP